MKKDNRCVNNYIRRITAFVAISALCLLMVEVFLHFFMPLYFTGFTQAYQYDEELGYRAMPGHHMALTDYQQELYVNRLGTINFQNDFNDYKYLIFALGDSYTQGTGLYSDASYPFQLDLMLNVDASGKYIKKYGVVNLGLCASGGEQQLLILKRYIGLIGKPSIVLYLGSNNDYNDDILFKSGVRHKNLVKNNPRYGLLYYPLSSFFTYSEIGKRIKYLIYEIVRSPVSEKRKLGQTTNSYDVPAAKLEEDIIKKIVDTAKTNHAQTILSWSNAGSSYDWLKSWTKQNNEYFADWFPSVRSVNNAIPSLPLQNQHSGRHYRTWVNNLIARTFAEKIKGVIPE